MIANLGSKLTLSQPSGSPGSTLHALVVSKRGEMTESEERQDKQVKVF